MSRHEVTTRVLRNPSEWMLASLCSLFTLDSGSAHVSESGPSEGILFIFPISFSWKCLRFLPNRDLIVESWCPSEKLSPPDNSFPPCHHPFDSPVVTRSPKVHPFVIRNQECGRRKKSQGGIGGNVKIIQSTGVTNLKYH